MTRNKAIEYTEEARRILNFLASMPGGHSTAISAVVRQMQLSTGGQLFAQGKLYDIVAKPVGGGVYRITLEKS